MQCINRIWRMPSIACASHLPTPFPSLTFPPRPQAVDVRLSRCFCRLLIFLAWDVAAIFRHISYSGLGCLTASSDREPAKVTYFANWIQYVAVPHPRLAFFVRSSHPHDSCSLNVLEVEAARAEVARRYFKGFGPATTKDFQHWGGRLPFSSVTLIVGITLTEARHSVALLADELMAVQVEVVVCVCRCLC